MTTTTASPFLFDAVEPQYVDGPAARCACWRFGKTAAPPLVMCMRFRLDRSHAEILPNQRKCTDHRNPGEQRACGTACRNSSIPSWRPTALMPAVADECPIAGTMRPELTVRSARLRGL
jgi:hypothetical protein